MSTIASLSVATSLERIGAFLAWISADVAIRSTVLSKSMARCTKRATRSVGIAGRGPSACAAR